jgi:hypothetical protein
MMLGQQIGECLICKLLQTLPLSRVELSACCVSGSNWINLRAIMQHSLSATEQSRCVLISVKWPFSKASVQKHSQALRGTMRKQMPWSVQARRPQ